MSQISLLIFIIQLGFVGIPTAYAADGCSRPDVESLTLPVYPGQVDSPTFSYKFQIIRQNETPDAPTVVVLPGGPGMTSIGDPVLQTFIPAGFNAIFTDQRGSGCNDLSASGFPEAGYSTANFAEDVIAVIAHLGLKNYVLYGHSYGTVQATITASLIEQKIAAGLDLEKPSAVVLEGVVGRAFRRDEPLHAYQAEWLKVRDKLPLAIESVVSSSELPFTDLAEAETKWGYFIQKQLYLGSVPEPLLGVMKDLETDLTALGSLEPGVQANLSNQVDASAFTDYGYTFRLVGCRDVFERFPNKMILSSGQLVGVGNYCDGLAMDRPFDSKDWPVSVPVFYFVGSNDQATPLWQGNYHFQNHRSGKKFFVTIGEASHVPLQISMYLAGCKKKTWTSIIQGGSGFEEAIASCNWPWPISVATKP